MRAAGCVRRPDALVFKDRLYGRGGGHGFKHRRNPPNCSLNANEEVTIPPADRIHLERCVSTAYRALWRAQHLAADMNDEGLEEDLWQLWTEVARVSDALSNPRYHRVRS